MLSCNYRKDKDIWKENGQLRSIEDIVLVFAVFDQNNLNSQSYKTSNEHVKVLKNLDN